VTGSGSFSWRSGSVSWGDVYLDGCLMAGLKLRYGKSYLGTFNVPFQEIGTFLVCITWKSTGFVKVVKVGGDLVPAVGGGDVIVVDGLDLGLGHLGHVSLDEELRMTGLGKRCLTNSG
jgi:hypothetical protein